MKEIFELIFSQYPIEKKKLFAGNELANYIRNKIPNNIQKEAFLTKPYIVQAAPGKGRWTDTPWIAIFDSEITKSAMFGYYPVYLFSADFKSVYLSLNQGWTQYERRYKPTSKAKETIVQNATKLKNVLISPLREFLFQPINLNTNNTLGVGYELGHVCGVRYNSDALPENEVLLNDLRNMIGVYRELKGKVGTDIFNLENIDLEESEPKSSPEDDKVVKDSLDKIQGDEEIKNALKKLEEKYFAEPPERKKRLGYAFARNKKLADLVKKIAGYKCYNCKLPGFEKKNGELYAEAHHIWELGKEGKDIPTNLICVCANCHRKIHYGKEAILVNH